jgi:hypothetical protein
MSFDVCGFDSNGGAQGFGCFSRRAGHEQIEAALAEVVGGECVGCGHGFLQDKG